MSREALYFTWMSITALYVAAIIFVLGFALLRGRSAEKYGALVYFASVVLSTIVNVVWSSDRAVIFEMTCDAAAAVGFLLLALRFNSLWLGAAMMVKGVQLALHATHLTDHQDLVVAGTNVYALGLTLISFVILGIIFGGTLASVRHGRRTRAAAVAPGGARDPRVAPAQA